MAGRPTADWTALLLCAGLQDEMGEHAVTAVVATWPGEDGQPEVHFEVSAAAGVGRDCYTTLL